MFYEKKNYQDLEKKYTRSKDEETLRYATSLFALPPPPPPPSISPMHTAATVATLSALHPHPHPLHHQHHTAHTSRAGLLRLPFDPPVTSALFHSLFCLSPRSPLPIHAYTCIRTPTLSSIHPLPHAFWDMNIRKQQAKRWSVSYMSQVARTHKARMQAKRYASLFHWLLLYVYEKVRSFFVWVRVCMCVYCGGEGRGEGRRRGGVVGVVEREWEGKGSLCCSFIWFASVLFSCTIGCERA